MQTSPKPRIGSFLEQTAVVWKTALGSGIVWEIARLTGSKHPYLAPLTFILCLQATVGQSVRYALYRALGTVIGVLMIGFFAQDIPVTAWALGIALLASTALMKIVRANDMFIHQVALSILFVLYFENHSVGYAWDRVKDTLIGAIIGVLFITLVFPPNTLRKTEQAIDKLVERFTHSANILADALQQNLLHSSRNPREWLNTLLDEVDQITASLNQIKQGAPFQFYIGKSDVETLTKQCHSIRDACVHFVSMTWSLTEDMTEACREQWSNRVRSLAARISTITDRNAYAPEATESLPFGISRQQSTVFDPDVAEHELSKIHEALQGFTCRSRPRSRPRP